MLEFNFSKPTSAYSYDFEEVKLACFLNSIGAVAWHGLKKNVAAFERGDASKRTSLKKKIKKHLKISQKNHCYYCGCKLDRFTDSGIHIDHILPKGAIHGCYECFTFEPKNLVLACFRCNGTEFKYQKDYILKYNKDYNLISFKIVHPYFDDIVNYISCNMLGVVENINPAKGEGQYMIDEFDLNSEELITLRLNSINTQALKINPELQRLVDEAKKKMYPSGYVKV
ncbi:HNH endonuclease family protein [Yersinia enterocolitica]